MFILALDEGTTGVTASLMDEKLNLISSATEDFPQHFPKPGWVEHDLDEIWAANLSVIEKAVTQAEKKVPSLKSQIACIGITNQRETICFWNKNTATPYRKAIVWQDRRTAEECKKLKKRGLEKLFQNKTGLLLDPYFSGTKVSWVFKNDPTVKKAYTQGELAVGTIDSFIIAKLTQGASKPAHVTEPSNASRTLCFDIHKEEFSKELCKKLKIPLDIWPEVKPSAGEFAQTKGVSLLPDGIPITGVLGDQQSALLGQACLTSGTAKCTYGTGAFVLLNTGKKPMKSKHRLLTTIAWKIKNQPTIYALEGSAFIAGAAVQWLRDGLGFIKDSSEIEALATSVSDSEGVSFVPALAGLGAPHWNPDARGVFSGLTRGTTRAHLARAVLESIALQITDILSCMQKDSKPTRLTQLNVDGGASANNFLMQFQSDVLGVKLLRPQNLETTSLGAVFAAGLGIGIWNSVDEIKTVWKKEREFSPQMKSAQKNKILNEWHLAVSRALIT